MSPSAEFDERAIVDEAQADPNETIRRADEVVADRSRGEREHAVARWARGLAHRELDRLGAAREDLEVALSLARRGAPGLAARIAVSLALVLAYQGDSDRALELLDASEADLPADARGAFHVQRGLIRHRRGELPTARSDYATAAREIGDTDPLLLARTLINWSILEVYEGRPSSAVRHLERAGEILADRGQPLLRAYVEHNLGVALADRGDVVDALAAFARAEDLYRTLGEAHTRTAVVSVDRAATLLAAGLVDEADRESTAALERFAGDDPGADRAEAALLATRVRLARGDPVRAIESLEVAAESFAGTGRSSWLPVVDLLGVEAETVGGASIALAERADRLARTLEAARWLRYAPHARLMAGRLFLAVGSVDRARGAFGPIIGPIAPPSPFDRSAAWLARALLAEAEGDAAAARRSVTRGLRALWDSRLARSHYEVRAHASRHAAELAAVGYRLAATDGRARELIERVDVVTRLATLPLPTRAPGDPDVRDRLEELHAVARRASDAQAGSGEAEAIERRRRELERSITRLARTESAPTSSSEVSTRTLVAALGESSLLVFAVLDGLLLRAVVRNGRSRLDAALALDEVRGAVESQTFAVARAQRPSLSAPAAEANELVLRAANDDLDRIVPSPVRCRRDPVVVVAPGELAGVCWGALPSMHGRSVVVAPSWSAWYFARERRRSAGIARVLLASGPDLECAGEECETIARRYPGRVVEVASDVRTVRRHLERADVAHFACHGTFRADNPLFSSLLLADGMLTFYDLEQAERLPHTFVLSACNAGRRATVNGAALLGMATSLLQLGVASVVAPLTVVNDARSPDLMVRLHERLASGADAATALAEAARRPDGSHDPMATPYVCFGS